MARGARLPPASPPRGHGSRALPARAAHGAPGNGKAWGLETWGGGGRRSAACLSGRPKCPPSPVAPRRTATCRRSPRVPAHGRSGSSVSCHLLDRGPKCARPGDAVTPKVAGGIRSVSFQQVTPLESGPSHLAPRRFAARGGGVWIGCERSTFAACSLSVRNIFLATSISVQAPCARFQIPSLDRVRLSEGGGRARKKKTKARARLGAAAAGEGRPRRRRRLRRGWGRDGFCLELQERGGGRLKRDRKD